MKIPLLPSIFFFFLVSSCFLIPGVSAVTITGATFTDTVQPGQVFTHTISIHAENVNETGKIFDISVSGDNPEWVTVDKNFVKLTDAGQNILVTVEIPTTGTNGNYTSAVMFTAEEKASSMIKVAIRVPLHITITGGKEATPTPGAIEQVPVTTIKEKMTNVETSQPTQKMGTVSTQTPAPVTTTETPAPAVIPIWAFVIAGLGLAGIVILAWILYDEHRGEFNG
jgi:hypothetical protein